MGDEVDFSGVVAWAKRRDPVRAILVGMVVVWSATFIALGWLRHSRYTTYGFDLGIYDQATWLLSRFRSTRSGDVVRNAFRHPTTVIRLATRPGCISYYRMMIIPVAVLALAAPVILLRPAGRPAPPSPSAPSASPRSRGSTATHYTSLVVAARLVASIEGIANVGRRPAVRPSLAAGLVAVSFAAGVAWGRRRSASSTAAGYDPSPRAPLPATKAATLWLVPGRAPVAATYASCPT